MRKYTFPLWDKNTYEIDNFVRDTRNGRDGYKERLCMVCTVRRENVFMQFSKKKPKTIYLLTGKHYLTNTAKQHRSKLRAINKLLPLW